MKDELKANFKMLKIEYKRKLEDGEVVLKAV